MKSKETIERAALAERAASLATNGTNAAISEAIACALEWAAGHPPANENARKVHEVLDSDVIKGERFLRAVYGDGGA